MHMICVLTNFNCCVLQNPLEKDDIDGQSYQTKEHDTSKHTENLEKGTPSTGLNEEGINYMQVK